MVQQLHEKQNRAETPALPEVLENNPLTGWLRDKGWAWHEHQLEVLESAKSGKDTLLIAPTGGGKTMAGFLPSFVDLCAHSHPEHTLHTLYISPLKALAVDVHRNVGAPIEELSLPITYETRTGDTPASKRQRQKTKPPHMLMTTPESLALLLSYEESDKYFKHLKYIVLDEIHALMHSKRGDLLSLNMARLAELAPEAQRIGLSATVAEPELALNWLARKNHGNIINVRHEVKPKIDILVGKNRMPWSGHMATYAVPEIYQAVAKAGMSVVFVNTRAQAELIFQELWKVNDKNLRIAMHHGSLDRSLRRKVEEMMSGGELDCVVATSSLDLGLDWAAVDLVVQIGAPKGVSRLLQRIGRSNHRMDEPSSALLVPASRFEYLECLAAKSAIEDGIYDGGIPRDGGLDVLAQHIFARACVGPFDADDFYEEVIQAWPYRDLDKQTFDKTLSFVKDGGYALKSYERFGRLIQDGNGYYILSDKRYRQQYRMNIGTIVEAPALKVKLRHKTLGTIEEWFINKLSPGDTFYFGGQVLRFEGLRDMQVMVSKTKQGMPSIPSYAGGRMPLSSHLAEQVRHLVHDETLWGHLPTPVKDWLLIQKERSVLPSETNLVVETFARQGKFFTVAYPFEGWNAHQTLGFLMMRRMQRFGYKPLGFVASDYGIAVWSLKKPEDIEGLFSQDMLADDLEEWLSETPLMKRNFRTAAVIAGLIERRHPGQQKTGRQMTFSSDLIYDVLRKYEPDHILLRAAYEDAAEGLIDLKRLSSLLRRVEGQIIHHDLEKVSPLAVPLILEISRESMNRETVSDYLFEDMEEELLKEAGLEENG